MSLIAKLVPFYRSWYKIQNLHRLKSENRKIQVNTKMKTVVSWRLALSAFTMKATLLLVIGIPLALVPGAVVAVETGTILLAESWIGVVSLILFAFAYLLVILEEYTHLKKSKPVLLAAGLIWRERNLW
ncbi:MAG: membrane-anchored protein YejM (alkaline phosphatase superfamily) [Rhodothermales bacterium]